MELRGPILCANDVTDGADAALRQACSLGADLGTSVTVCHVLPEFVNIRVLFPHEAGVDASVQAELTRKATAAVRARLEEVVGVGAGDVGIWIETGTAHAGILAAAERVAAGVIVMGPGATALRVARSATMPVLVARPSPIGGAVLGATDFSDPALPAVKMAAAEATRRRARLRLVHCLALDEAVSVAEAAMPGVVAVWPFPQSVIDRIDAAARERLAAALAEIAADGQPIVLRSPPATGILQAARSVATALIVVGTRGRTGLARLAIGSVAESVIHGAPCSVLVVPLTPA